MKADGAPVIELTIGEHDRGTDRSILDAMHESALGGNTGYAAVPGSPALRERIAARIAERTGVATGPENVLVVPGGQAALLYAHHAVCNPGDTALFIDPHYATFPGTIRAVGAKPLAIRASAENGFLPDPQDVARAAVGAASLLINSPNNPTGAVYGERILEGLARVARDHGMWVVSDEVYDTQVWDGAHLSIRACDAMAAQTLVVGSLSKSHAMTGSRIGWVVGPEEAIAHMENLALCANYGVAGFVQDAALFALGLVAEFERRVAAPFLRRRDLALKRIAAQRIVRAARPAGAMYLMLDIRETGTVGDESSPSGPARRAARRRDAWRELRRSGGGARAGRADGRRRIACAGAPTAFSIWRRMSRRSRCRTRHERADTPAGGRSGRDGRHGGACRRAAMRAVEHAGFLRNRLSRADRAVSRGGRRSERPATRRGARRSTSPQPSASSARSRFWPKRAPPWRRAPRAASHRFRRRWMQGGVRDVIRALLDAGGRSECPAARQRHARRG